MALTPLSGLLAHKATAKPGPFGFLVRAARGLCKLFIRPWLDFQTRFNHGAIETLADQSAVTQRAAAAAAARLVNLEAVVVRLELAQSAATARSERAEAAAAEFREREAQLRTDISNLQSAHHLTHTRVGIVTTALRQVKADLIEMSDAFRQAKGELADLRATAQALPAEFQQELARVVQAVEERAGAQLTGLVEKQVTEAGRMSDERQAESRAAVNRELGPVGEIAAAGLWFNPPVAVVLADRPVVNMVTERIVEHIFVHNRIPRPPAKVLDMGCAESTTAIELASLGFEVVGVDLRRLPLDHPNFTMVEANLGHLPFADGEFDIVVCLSTIEHVGLGWYTKDDPTTDHTALREAVRVLRAGGTFLLTVPFGRAAVTPVHRVYDLPQLEQLIAPLSVREMSFAVRDGDAWTFTTDPAQAGQADSTERVGAVALIVAEKS